MHIGSFGNTRVSRCKCLALGDSSRASASESFLKRIAPARRLFTRSKLGEENSLQFVRPGLPQAALSREDLPPCYSRDRRGRTQKCHNGNLSEASLLSLGGKLACALQLSFCLRTAISGEDIQQQSASLQAGLSHCSNLSRLFIQSLVTFRVRFEEAAHRNTVSKR
jgi:hypothetical protein